MSIPILSLILKWNPTSIKPSSYMEKITYLRQFLSNYLQGPNTEALIGTLADEAEKLEKTAIAVNDQLYISTASSDYLARKLSEIGIIAPPDLGIDDLAFRKISIEVNAKKMVPSVLHSVLQAFFGDDTVRASATNTVSAPWPLVDGDELWIELEDGQTYKVPFQTKDFRNINEANAQEVADIISRFFRSVDIGAYASTYTNPRSGETFVVVYGSALGPYSMTKIVGGEVQSKLEFPSMRPTKLSDNSTIWEVTRTIGSTLRFRWYSGPKPALENVTVGDVSLIYGDAFKIYGLDGTFPVVNMRPATSIPAYDSGWFEIENSEVSGIKSTPPDIQPAPNTPTDTYSYLIPQSDYAGLKFFLPYKNTSYGKNRYALAFEPRNDLLKIYIPATTQVVHRDIIGSMHMHVLYDQLNLNGSYGHATDNQKQIVVINDKSISYPSIGYDNDGNGGFLSYGSNLIPVEKVTRTGGRTVVECTIPHNIKGAIEWLSTSTYLVGQVTYFEGQLWEAILPSGGMLGAQRPDFSATNFWRYIGGGINYSSTIVTVTVNDLEYELPDAPLGPYVVDPSAPYTLTNNVIYSREKIVAGTKIKTLFIAGLIDTTSGMLLFDLNKTTQEGPVYFYSSQVSNAPTTVSISNLSQNGHKMVIICSGHHGAIAGSKVQISGITAVAGMNGQYTVDSTPNSYTYTCTSGAIRTASVVNEGQSSTLLDGASTTLVIDPSYTFKHTHSIGSDITVLSDRKAYTPEIDGSDYSAYVTGTAEGRIYCQELMDSIVALGIKLEVIIVYPSTEGLGKGDAEWVWG